MFQRLAAIALTVFLGLPVMAQDRQFTLHVPGELVETGFLKHLLPRFSLKTSIRIAVTQEGDAAQADAVLTQSQDLTLTGRTARARPVFSAITGGTYGLILTQSQTGAGSDHATRFAEWLTSETGARTIEAFQRDGRQLYTASIEAAVEVAQDAPEGDIVLGEELSLRHCGRCHVINEKNRMNGLGSTPSFRALKAMQDWDYRFQVFHVLNPHPAFTQIADVTEPFDPMRPSPIAPMDLTQDDLDAILAYVYSLVPADLGAPVQAQ